MPKPKCISAEAERALLGGLLLDCSQYPAISTVLCPNDFGIPGNCRLFALMGQAINKFGHFDIPIIASLGGYPDDVLHEIVHDCASTSHLLSYADIIREKSVQRQLLVVANEVKEATQNPNQDLRALLNDAERKILAIAKHVTESEEVGLCKIESSLGMYFVELGYEIESACIDEEYLQALIVDVNRVLVRELDDLEENMDHRERECHATQER